MTLKKVLTSKLGLLGLLIIFFGNIYLLAGEIAKRYVIEKQIDALKLGIIESEKTSTDLSTLIEYFQSPSFQEKEVRRKLNLQKLGEHVVVLPADQNLQSQAGTGSMPEPSWKQWWQYFFGS